MQTVLTPLPDDPLELRAVAPKMADQLLEIEQQLQHATQQIQQIEQLFDYIELLRRKRFGASADHLPKEQPKLRDEAELSSFCAKSTGDADEILKSKLARRLLPAHLKWVETVINLSEDGRLEIDNNKAENAIRPFVIGRKNFLFSGSPRGAHASATLYSLIETAKVNGLDPRAYLNYLFDRLPVAKSGEALRALLPNNLKTEDLALAVRHGRAKPDRIVRGRCQVSLQQPEGMDVR